MLRVGPIPPALSQASPPAVCAGGAMMSPRGLATGSAGTGSATTGEIADAIVETGSAIVIVIGVIGVPIGETTPASGRGTDVTIIDDREREAIVVSQGPGRRDAAPDPTQPMLTRRATPPLMPVTQAARALRREGAAGPIRDRRAAGGDHARLHAPRTIRTRSRRRLRRRARA